MKLTLKKKKQETSDIISLIFSSDDKINWIAGQYLHYVLHHEPTDDRGSDRWFTISSAPHEGFVMLTTRFDKVKGSSFKNELNHLNEGDIIEFSDLDGDFILEDLNAKYVFIAGGIGITPYRAILKDLESKSNNVDVILLYANRDDNFVFKDELDHISIPNLKIKYIEGRINIDDIKNSVSDINDRIFYISGPEGMVDSMGEALKELEITDSNIKQDWFPGYD